MERELALLLAVTRRLPRIRGAGRVVSALRRWYLRRPRGEAIAAVRGSTMALRPADYVDGWLLFAPRFYEDENLSFVARNLSPGDVFVDIGAHIGLYSLVASRAVGPSGRVLSIEADPATYLRLGANVARNALTNVTSIQAGVSDRVETLTLSTPDAEHASSSFLWSGGETVAVDCRPLLDLMREAGMSRIDGMKCDIEGLEYRVLSQFFRLAPPALMPRFIVFECVAQWIDRAGGSSLDLVRSNGYRIVETYSVAGQPVGYAAVRE